MRARASVSLALSASISSRRLASAASAARRASDSSARRSRDCSSSRSSFLRASAYSTTCLMSLATLRLSSGVRSCSVAPGVVGTPMSSGRANASRSSDAASAGAGAGAGAGSRGGARDTGAGCGHPAAAGIVGARSPFTDVVETRDLTCAYRSFSLLDGFGAGATTRPNGRVAPRPYDADAPHGFCREGTSEACVRGAIVSRERPVLWPPPHPFLPLPLGTDETPARRGHWKHFTNGRFFSAPHRGPVVRFFSASVICPARRGRVLHPVHPSSFISSHRVVRRTARRPTPLGLIPEKKQKRKRPRLFPPHLPRRLRYVTTSSPRARAPDGGSIPGSTHQKLVLVGIILREPFETKRHRSIALIS